MGTKLTQYFQHQMKTGFWVTPDDLIDIAPKIRAAMKAAGLQMFDLKQIPASLLRGLCSKYAPGKGFRTRCIADISETITDKGAFCNWLEGQCLSEGHVPSRSVPDLDEQVERIAKAVYRQIKQASGTPRRRRQS